MTVHAEDLTDAWVKKTLTTTQIRLYLVENIVTEMARENAVGLMHVAECCRHLYLWATHQLPGLGGFLTAVKDDSLSRAVQYADGTNKTALWVYVAFLYNVAPAGWRKRGEKGGGEGDVSKEL